MQSRHILEEPTLKSASALDPPHFLHPGRLAKFLPQGAQQCVRFSTRVLILTLHTHNLPNLPQPAPTSREGPHPLHTSLPPQPKRWPPLLTAPEMTTYRVPLRLWAGGAGGAGEGLLGLKIVMRFSSLKLLLRHYSSPGYSVVKDAKALGLSLALKEQSAVVD